MVYTFFQFYTQSPSIIPGHKIISYCVILHVTFRSSYHLEFTLECSQRRGTSNFFFSVFPIASHLPNKPSFSFSLAVPLSHILSSHISLGLSLSW